MISKEELEKWAFQLNMDGDCDATDKDIENLITQALDTMEELETAKRCLPVDKEFEVRDSWIGSVQNYITHLEESLEVMDSEPVAWTDEQELRDVDRGGCGYLFTVNPVTPHADERRIILLYRHAQPASEREQVRRDHAEWSQATFGNVGPIGPLKHLSKEALEAAAEPDDLSEWADMQFLLWDAQRRAGITDAQITQAMIDKLAVNKNREWPEPKDGEPRLHIKEQSAPELFKTREDYPGWFQSQEEKEDAIKNIQQGLDVVKSRASECWDGIYSAIKGRGKRSEGDFTPDLSMSPEEFIREFRKLASSSTPGSLYYHVTVEWIPVGERMPEIGKHWPDVTVIIATSGEKYGSEALYCSDGNFRWGRDEQPIEDVTHWMPLPTAPKEQDNV